MSAVAVFAFVVLVCFCIKRYYRRFLLGISVPGPWAIPLLGNAQMIGKMKPEFIFLIFTELRERFNATYRLWLGPLLWIFLHSAEETRDALNDATLVKADTFNQLNVLIGNGLLISHGKYWHRQRRILGPAFHPEILRSFATPIAQHADKLVEKLRRTKGAEIEVGDYLFACLLDAIVDTSMGKKLNTQDEQDSIYTHAFHKTSELLFKRMINPLLSFDFIFKMTNHCKKLNESLDIIHTLMETVIYERQAVLQQNKVTGSESVEHPKARLTLLDTLLTAKIDGEERLTFREIRDEVNTFVFAGVDTTTASMTFVLYALAKYPSAQAKLSAEIEAAIVEANDDDDGIYNMDALNKLVYLEMFLKECLRYYTIVPTTGRQTTCDTKIGGRIYPKDITLWINIYGLAHDATYFPRPYDFWPERWSHEAPQPIAFSYLPFSGGPHVCIGRKYSWLLMKVLTVKLLRNFQLVLSEAETQKDLVLQAQMVLKSMHGINIIFEPRTRTY